MRRLLATGMVVVLAATPAHAEPVPTVGSALDVHAPASGSILVDVPKPDGNGVWTPGRRRLQVQLEGGGGLRAVVLRRDVPGIHAEFFVGIGHDPDLVRQPSFDFPVAGGRYRLYVLSDGSAMTAKLRLGVEGAGVEDAAERAVADGPARFVTRPFDVERGVGTVTIWTASRLSGTRLLMGKLRVHTTGLSGWCYAHGDSAHEAASYGPGCFGFLPGPDLQERTITDWTYMLGEIPVGFGGYFLHPGGLDHTGIVGELVFEPPTSTRPAVAERSSRRPPVDLRIIGDALSRRADHAVLRLRCASGQACVVRGRVLPAGRPATVTVPARRRGRLRLPLQRRRQVRFARVWIATEAGESVLRMPIRRG